MGKLPQTPRAKKVIEYSMEEARNLNHNYVGTEHILLALLELEDGTGVLAGLGVDKAAAEASITAESR
jgi:ATP-dependent Clp protease ATP-binding subunit ClpA